MSANIPVAVLVAGPAGAGKSTFSKYLAGALHGAHLDKDVLSQLWVETMLPLLGSTADDRDSDIYRQRVRPLEYQTLLNTALRMVANWEPVVLDAPFIPEVADANWRSWWQGQVSAAEGLSVVVWMRTGLDAQKDRLHRRGLQRDMIKLAHWTQYADDLQTVVPAQPVVEIDNDGDMVRLHRQALGLARQLAESAWDGFVLRPQ